MTTMENLAVLLSSYWVASILIFTICVAMYLKATDHAGKKVRQHIIRYRELLAREKIVFFESDSSRKLPPSKAYFTFTGKTFDVDVSSWKTLRIIHELEEHGYVDIDQLEDMTVRL